VYVNGVLVGTTAYQYPPRRYEIPAGILKPGKNIFVVRVINSAGKGGFVVDKPYWFGVGDDRISLEGKWRYRLGTTAEPLPSTTFFQYQPSGLFNGMIASLVGYRVKGVIWYQGEANAGEAYAYRSMFPTMIRNWRAKWNDEFPFFWAQLANFMEPVAVPSQSEWAELREAQHMTLSLPKTGEAVLVDIGEAKDIHPKNKQDVGYRLALAALKTVYNKDIVYSGPAYKSMEVKGDRIELTFDHTGSGLLSKGDRYGYLRGFSIAGDDQKFVWAQAFIDGNKVVVSAKGIAHPVAVRYAWADNPDDANLFNKEGLPASPFRTDTWKGVTEKK